MTTKTSETLMDERIWTGKIFNGEWIYATGGTSPIVESATGAHISMTGHTNVDDIDRAAERAAQAQVDWASTPFSERAAVLRRAALLFEEQAAEIQSWLVRESGSTGPKAGFELHVAANECYEAAATAISSGREHSGSFTGEASCGRLLSTRFTSIHC